MRALGEAADLASWRRRFEEIAGCHGDVQRVAAPADTSALARAIGRSLATFQLGESGTGAHLFAAAAGLDTDYQGALRCFVAEEQEHARMLALVLDALGVARRQHHWSERVFVALRRSHSLRAEVLTLLVAEVVALTYYAALRDGVGDEQLADIFARIHDDEIRHVDFHAATLPPHLRRFRPATYHASRLAWNLLVAGSGLVVALDHGRALRSVGLRRWRAIRNIDADRRALDRRLFGSRRRSPSAL